LIQNCVIFTNSSENSAWSNDFLIEQIFAELALVFVLLVNQTTKNKTVEIKIVFDEFGIGLAKDLESGSSSVI